MKYQLIKPHIHTPPLATPRRFTAVQYIFALVTLLFGSVVISYAATNFTVFTNGSTISSQQLNDNFTNIKETLAALDTAIKANQTPAGTLVAFSGTTIPAGYIQCPSNQISAIVSRSQYPALFAAIGTTWGAGDGATTFVMPWFPEGYTFLQTISSVGTQSIGQVIAHTHALAPASPGQGGGADGGQRLIANGGSSWATGSTGVGANFAAGTNVIILVKI